MGLDISYFSDAQKVDPQPAKDADGQWPNEVYDADMILAFTLRGMDRSLRGLQDETFYAAQYRGAFRAGSYSGYNQWRNHLCEFALGIPAETLWSDPEAYYESPFYELINFADNEGTIGPHAAADLYVDFCTEQEKVLAAAAKELTAYDAEYFSELYMEWKEAFHVAGTENGLVDFH